MTLAGRVSAFFLAALAGVLAIVVGALWLTARQHFDQQLHARLGSGVHSLAGAVEVEPHELEWDPAEHQIALGREAARDRVQWIIRDAEGRIVDQSPEIPPPVLAVLTGQAPSAIAPSSPTAAVPTHVEGEWLVMHQRLMAADPSAAPPDEPVEPFDYTELTFSGVVSTEPMRESLGLLAWTAGGLAAVMWCLAALAGRWYCRRAIAPLLRMADDARRLTSRVSGAMLDVPHTADEVESLGTAFNGLLEKWREIYERQSSFSASVAHQLRSPLTVMLGELELALRRPRSPEEQLAVIRQTHAAAEELRRTIEGLLFLTRSEAETEPPDATAIDLNVWLQEQAARWRAGPRGGDVTVDDRCHEVIVVRGSRVLLGEMLQNLVDNALQYSPTGRPVRIELTADGESARVTVIDEGPGISPGDLPHIFKPFFRSDAVRVGRPAGTGLGLPLAARIAELHGGRLTVDSQLGKGSRFCVSLPRRTGRAETIAAQSCVARSAERPILSR
jgi:signal transduction histidine kinase